MRAGELTFNTTSRSKDSAGSAAILANEGSRSLTLSGSPAQLSSSRRLATPRLLEHFRLSLLGLKPYSGRSAAAVLFKVRRAESERRESTRDRKSAVT